VGKYATDPSSACNALSYSVKNATIGTIDPDIFDEMRQFLATLYQTFTNEPCQLWSYWTEFHEIFTQYTDIIYVVNAYIEVVPFLNAEATKVGSLPFQSSRS